MKEGIQMKGAVTVIVTDSKTGEIKYKKTQDNLILTNGKYLIASLLGGQVSGGSPLYLTAWPGVGSGAIWYIAVGTGTTPPVVGDTDLETDGMSGDTPTKQTTNTRTGATIRFSATWNDGEADGTWSEAVLCNNTTYGSRCCLSRVLIGPITKGAGDVVSVIWDITFS